MGELIDILNTTYDKIERLKPPEILGIEEKTGEWMAEVLKEGEVNPVTKLRKNIDRYPLDAKYWVCDREEFNKIVKWDWTDNKKYVAEKYDCDNFAFSFKAMVDRRFGVNNVGLVIDYSGGHAYNIIVFNDGTVRLFEPQTDKWPRLGTGMYKFEEGKILI